MVWQYSFSPIAYWFTLFWKATKESILPKSSNISSILKISSSSTASSFNVYDSLIETKINLNSVVKYYNGDADLIISYLDQFKLDLVSELKKHKNIDKFIKSID